MSEYQYYEFLAVDRPLDQAAREALRSISSRARITATSFTNHYEWGDFKGDPKQLMERWFDLHLYFANWGTRRLMLRVPKRFLPREDIASFLGELDWVEVSTAGDHSIVDIHQEAEDGGDWSASADEDEDGTDLGSAWLQKIAPLRADVLSGDLRLFYLLWLSAVQDELVADDAEEPLPGIGPLEDGHEAFAEFFGIDADLVRAAAEKGAEASPSAAGDLRAAVSSIPEGDKTELLLRLVEGDAHVVTELRRRMAAASSVRSAPCRTVGALRARAAAIRQARERAAAERREAERRRDAERAEQERRLRLTALRRRGEGVWREVEDEIGRRNASGYDRAAALLADLQALAAADGSREDFARRLAAIRERHAAKGKFIERLDKL